MITFQSFLIKYAEIGIKGKNRYVFEDALVREIRRAISRIDGEFFVYKTSGRIYVDAKDYDYDDLIEALKTVFGIVWICPVVQLQDEGFEKLAEEVVSYVDEIYPNKNFTFKVQTRRARKSYPMESMEVNADLGEAILRAFPETSVDVHDPEVLLHVEIREQVINVYSKMIPGPGGLPLGTNGKSMLLLSGGIDSPVAGWMIAKRGVILDATYFHAPPYTSERAKQKVVDLAKIISRYTGPIELHVVNFTDIQLAIYERCPHEELTIIMRRYMMRIAERLAEENRCLGLVTGESIGQVASQTVQSLAATNDVCSMPVFRPLIGFDKNEIIEISQRIGAFETSIQPFEDCCTIFVAKHPVTKPNLNVIRENEKKLADVIDEMVETAIANHEKIWVQPE